MAFEIAVIGTGYVGLVSGTVFAATGNNVTCVDVDEEKVKMLKSGVCPIYEPGLERLLERNTKEGRLHFQTELESAILKANIVFLCLPTPPNEDGSADLNHVLNVSLDIAKILQKNKVNEPKIIVNKSTVPVGTSEKVKNIFFGEYPDAKIYVASNPEFLREGVAVEDATKPERIVVGTSDEYVKEIMKDLYEPFVRSGNPVIYMDEKSAEITKYAANSFLATKISFMNDLSRYCEEVGADIEQIRFGLGTDSRIGKRFLFAGIGYGGSCFPKDVKALLYSSEKAGTPLHIVNAASKVNELQSDRFVDRILTRFGANLSGKKFALWGLAFKPNTDDTREAPAFTIIEKLLEKGAQLAAYDPEAKENTMIRFGEEIEYAETMYDCLNDRDALIIATEWTVFRNPDFNKIGNLLKNKIIFDGRNLFGLDEMENLGFEYYSIGRRIVNPGLYK